MKAKTEEMLYLLLWTCDMISRPSFRNLTDSFEAWAYRNGLMRQLAELERRQLLEFLGTQRENSPTAERTLRLTEAGRLYALGGRDPEVQWRRSWDGQWRMVLFDLPNTQASARARLRRYLKDRGFGYLQNSVWITPDLWPEEKTILTNSPINVESLILFEGRPCAGESDEDIVSGAWDFPEINRLYAMLQGVLDARPTGAIRDVTSARAFRKWAAEERMAWLAIVSKDPLLPERVLPEDYLGRKVWRKRVQVLREAAKQLRSFAPSGCDQ